MKLENTRLQTEIKHQQLQLEQNAMNLKNMKDSQNQLKDDKEKLLRDLSKMEAIHEVATSFSLCNMQGEFENFHFSEMFLKSSLCVPKIKLVFKSTLIF